MHKAFILPLARYQRDRGLVVEFGVGEDLPAGYQTAVPELEAAGFRVHVVPFPYAIRPLADAAALVRLWRFFRRNRFDVVHTHTSKAGVLVRAAARLAGCPFVVHTGHELYFREFAPGWRRTVFVWIERFMSRITDVLMYTNPVIRDAAEAEGIRARLPSVVCGTTLRPLSAFAATAAEVDALRAELRVGPGPVVACAGRLVASKGIDTLVRAAARVVAERPDVQFVVFGGGPLESELVALADRLGVAANVHFTGFRTADRDVIRLLAMAAVFCLPTRREGLGLVFVEAMAMSVPVVGPRIAPITSVVPDGETGFLVEAEDDAAYAAAILRLLGDPELACRMGEAGRKLFTALYDPDKVFETITACYPLSDRGTV